MPTTTPPAPARTLRAILAMPWHVLALGTGAKSFADNPLIGSRRLNRLGLHTARFALAHRIAERRRRRLARHIDPALRAAFDADGYVVVPDFLPTDQFAALQTVLLGREAECRETVQGTTVTRRIPIGADDLRALPQLRDLLSSDRWLGVLHYGAASRATPQYYLQTIFPDACPGDPDPQTVLHADTFHPTMKAWYYLADVAADGGPFSYVAGSHRATPQRLAWERARSLALPSADDMLSSRGSLRAGPDDLEAMGLAAPTDLPVRANTLIVADTGGFHRRAHAANPRPRVELWAYSRPAPFLPGAFALSTLAQGRIGWLWRWQRRFPAWFGVAGHDPGPRRPLDPPLTSGPVERS